MTRDLRAPYALFRDDRAGQATLFCAPSEILVAESTDELFAAFERTEELRAKGKWLAGYVSYEAGYALEPKLAGLLPSGRRTPLLCFGVFDGPDDHSENLASANASDGNSFLSDPRATWSEADYSRRFERVHRHLRAGDCYQANLTFPVEAHWGGDPLALFDELTGRQPVSYGALVDLVGPVVLSRSPELFFRVDGDGWIESLPMKGTMPRGTNATEDAALKAALAADPKNQAENRMIVDLLRNDISRISEVGTLEVPELFRVESYPTVHQMVSRVRARLRRGTSIGEIFAALFPCGSITGAPKIRAMQILRELEERPRDVYCGAIGWIAPGGQMRFNVAIRTVSLYPGGEAIYNVGGGVVFDSTAEGEYAECLLKGRFATGQPPISN